MNEDVQAAVNGLAVGLYLENDTDPLVALNKLDVASEAIGVLQDWYYSQDEKEAEA